MTAREEFGEMSTKSFKRAEVIVNVAIVIVAVLLGSVLVKRYFGAPGENAKNAPPPIAAGTKISLSNVDWGKNGATLLMVVSTTCHYCSESAPFYRRLAHEVQGPKIQLVAVLPQELTEGKAYLDNLSVPINEIRQASLSSLGVSGTPTLILVSKDGIVMDSWLGKLSPDRESEVVTRLHSSTSN